MNVGWGKAETQFQGKAGKLSTQAPKAVAAEVPADDGKPRITWRGDGEFFVTSTLVRATAYAGSAFVWHSGCWCTTLRCDFALEVGAHKWIVCAHPLARPYTCADVRTMLMSLWQPQGPRGRRLRIWDREGVLQSTGEQIGGLEQGLAWRPQGSLIASTQRLPHR